MLCRHSAGDCGAPAQKGFSVAAGPNTCHGLMGQSALQERQALQKTKFTARCTVFGIVFELPIK